MATPPAANPSAGRQGNFGGKLQHQVSAAEQGGLGTDGFIHDGRSAPLDVIAAHQAHNGGISSAARPDVPELAQMPIVEGVIFANNADRFHGIRSFCKKIRF